jgi:hypothetical protein
VLSTCNFPLSTQTSIKPKRDTFPRMYVDDAVQYAQSAKGGGATAGIAALSLDPVPTLPTLWVLVELERPVFCPENSICVASKLEVHPSRSTLPIAQNQAPNPSPDGRSSMRPAAELHFTDASLAFCTIPLSACSSKFTKPRRSKALSSASLMLIQCWFVVCAPRQLTYRCLLI